MKTLSNKCNQIFWIISNDFKLNDMLIHQNVMDYNEYNEL